MKRIIAFALCLLLLVPTIALAVGKIEVKDERVYIYKSDHSSYTDVYLFAEIENTGNKPVQMDQGVFEIYDKNGDVIENRSIYSYFPSVIQPGETSQIQSTLLLENKVPDDIDDYKLQVLEKSYSGDALEFLNVVSAEIKDFPSYPGSERMEPAIVIVAENTSSKTLFNISATAGAYDSDGKLLFNVNNKVDVGVLPKSQIEFRIDVDSSVIAALTNDKTDSFASMIKTIKASVFEYNGW